MATRHNLSSNPFCGVDVTDWTSNGAAPVRTDVTGLGFDRQWAALFSDGSVAFSPQAAAAAGLAYTVSVHVKPTNLPINGNIFIEFLNGSGGSLGFSSSAFTAPLGAVTRISQSDIAPASTAFTRFVITGENYLSNPSYYTQHLPEQSAVLGSYFDGKTVPGGSWDGPLDSSTSTLVDVAQSLPPQSYATRRALLVR
jgi:hypothetical protein